jgi:hypothetical protein
MFQAIKRRAWVPLAAVAALIGAVAIAQAAIPSSNGTIHGCYHKNSGDLRVVENPATCQNSETALSWSQTGPQGPQGPTGPQGPKGDTGPAGSNDLYGSYERNVSLDASGPSGAQVVVGLNNLPAGTYLIQATINIGQFDCFLCTSDEPTHCFFVDQGGEFFNGYMVVFGEHEHKGQIIYPLKAIRTYSEPNTVQVKCYTEDDDAHVWAEMTALKVSAAGVKP